MKVQEFVQSLKGRLTKEDERIRLQFFTVYVIFSAISAGMSLVNLLTGYYALMYATLLFTVLNVVNAILARHTSRAERATHALFAVEAFLLFTFFLIVGEPEGFSAGWIALLPAAGMLLYRRKNGTILSAIGLLVLVFFFWTPIGRELLMYEYTDSFLLRFPLMYVAFYFVGLCFETIRAYTQEELELVKNRYLELSYTDSLTGLGNETRYLQAIAQMERRIRRGNPHFAVVFMDVNGVKATNDQFGHRFGCHLIVTVGKMLPTVFHTSQLFHVGGDEFVAIVTGTDYEHLEETIKALEDALSYKQITFEKQELTLSLAVGVAVYDKETDKKFNDVLQRADDRMYVSKSRLKQEYNIAIR